jgi:VWFA-related protein
LNKLLAEEVARAGRQVLEVVSRNDKIAIWTYADRVQQVADFSEGHDTLRSLFYNLNSPEVSETNLYDALISTFGFMKTVAGRKAVILISSGTDTFSHAKLEDVLAAARSGDTPVYALGMGPVLRTSPLGSQKNGPLSRINWPQAEKDLETIAQSSGGRTYFPRTTLDLAAMYDDIMENLRVRYVVSYKSSVSADPNLPRMIRVELVDSKTGGPLQIVDASGKTVRANVIFQDNLHAGHEVTSRNIAMN